VEYGTIRENGTRELKKKSSFNGTVTAILSEENKKLKIGSLRTPRMKKNGTFIETEVMGATECQRSTMVKLRCTFFLYGGTRSSTSDIMRR
jgi:hypothetical protein